jgi:hypothetical protein
MEGDRRICEVAKQTQTNGGLHDGSYQVHNRCILSDR